MQFLNDLLTYFAFLRGRTKRGPYRLAVSEAQHEAERRKFPNDPFIQRADAISALEMRELLGQRKHDA